MLLSAGADKEAKVTGGFTALIIAAQNGYDKCVEMLLTAGANKEATSQKGSTALIKAAENGHDKCVELLLNAGCDINALNNDGVSALQYAVQNEHIDCVHTLVRCGADVKVQYQGVSLDYFADRTTIADALKAALRLPAEKRRRCAHCDTTTSEKLQKCSACRRVYYCNRECQVAHWKRHKPACKSAE
jgi:ankyrin repeat protein